jgi:hypothetical protein
MTDLETLQRGTINALREQLRQQAEKPCPTCAAKDQTIALLADVVDWHRGQAGLHASSAVTSVTPHPDVSTVGVPVFNGDPQDLWATDEEEDIQAAIKAGVFTDDQADRALAYLQAQKTQIQLVK